MSDTQTAAGARAPAHAAHKGIILMVLGISQLMIILDASIVNVALRHMGAALHVFDFSDLTWVVTAYTLSFGGFLLLGGKLADRKSVV